jgi:hypothetical protein
MNPSPKNIEMKTQTLCTTKNYVNTKKLVTHQHTMFSNFKSSKKGFEITRIHPI